MAAVASASCTGSAAPRFTAPSQSSSSGGATRSAALRIAERPAGHRRERNRAGEHGLQKALALHRGEARDDP